MKKIIDGRRYDTATAEEIAVRSSGYSRSDFKFFEETLYKTAKGAWFLYGEGGGLSKYAEQCGDGRGWGSTIIPLEAEKAKDWLETHDFVDECEAHFGDSLQDA